MRKCTYCLAGVLLSAGLLLTACSGPINIHMDMQIVPAAEKESAASGKEETAAAAEMKITAEIKAEPADAESAAAENAGPESSETADAEEKAAKQFAFFTRRDIGNDGTEELFLSTTDKPFVGAEDHACILALINEEAKILSEIGGAGGETWYVDPETGALCLWSRLAGEEHFCVYSLNEGILKEEQKVDVYEPHHGPFEQDREETVYVLNGEETAKEEAEAVRDLYAKDENAVGFDQSLLPGEGENT